MSNKNNVLTVEVKVTEIDKVKDIIGSCLLYTSDAADE